MTPLDRAAGEQTGVRRAQDPAAGVAPVRRRVPPPEGGPALVSPEARAGGKTSPRPSERQAARTPDPGTGAVNPGGTRAAPGRGRAPRTPAGGHGSRAADDRSPLAGSQALSGAEWRKAAARAQRKTTRRPARQAARRARPSPGAGIRSAHRHRQLYRLRADRRARTHG